VLGRFAYDGESLRLLAEVVQQNPRTVETVSGTIASEEVTEGVFVLEVDPDQIADLPENLIDVLLQQGTKIFRRNGDLVEDENEIMEALAQGNRVRVVGFVDLATVGEEMIYSTIVVVDLPEEPLERTAGTFLSWDEIELEMELDADPAIVCVPADASVFLGGLDEDGNIRFDDVPDPSVFTPEITEVTALGLTNAEDCFEASTVIGFDREVSVP
jgi:hypothetical protein